MKEQAKDPKNQAKKVKTVSAIVVLIVVFVGLLVFFLISNMQPVAEKVKESAPGKTAQQESVEQESNIVSTMVTKITEALTGGSTQTTPQTTGTTKSSSSGGGGGGGGTSPQQDQETISKQEAESIARTFICEAAACPITITNSYLEGNYWIVEISDGENTAVLKINAYTGEITE